MTKNVISTSDVNVFIKKEFPSLHLSVQDLQSLGFEPLFKTSSGTYWDPAIVEQIELKIKAVQNAPAKPIENDDNYKKGYQAGYKARGKKEWRTVTDNEAKDLIQGAFANDEFLMDIGWLLHTFEDLLKAKNHG